MDTQSESFDSTFSDSADVDFVESADDPEETHVESEPEKTHVEPHPEKTRYNFYRGPDPTTLVHTADRAAFNKFYGGQTVEIVVTDKDEWIELVAWARALRLGADETSWRTTYNSTIVKPNMERLITTLITNHHAANDDGVPAQTDA